MVTPKSSRMPLPKNLDQYVVSIQKLSGEPETFSDSSFIDNDFIIPGDSTLTNKYGDSLPLGFDLTLNGKTYTQFSVAGSGWLMLKDPDGGTVGSTFWHDVLYFGGFKSISSNNEIRDIFLYDHIIIAPWFDQLRMIVKDVATLQSSLYAGIITTSIANNIAQGKDNRSWPFDVVDRGVRYKNFVDNIKGKCLLVRWTASDQAYKYRLKFEVKIYESGRIEFLYWPIKNYVDALVGPSLTSTSGIFWSGANLGQHKFRDFSPLFSYDVSVPRQLSDLGGASYDSGYADTTKKYSHRMNIDNWPKNGAIITLTPPTNLRKFLPRKIIANSAKSFLKNHGLFDDRKAIDFGQSTKIHYPSNLPSRLSGDSGTTNISLNQQLFTSGGIEEFGYVSATNINDLFDQLERDPNTQIVDNSFNESEKNYGNDSDFYATGSALSLFGENFTGPLKSKTQFNFKLPITKQVTMPSLTSSIYYYDTKEKSWRQPAPGDVRAPESTSVLHKSTNPANYYGPDKRYFYYKITETSRGFDAVGRKIVSGSRILDLNPALPANYGIAPDEPTFQTNNIIGMLVNDLSNYDSTDNNSILYANALESKYTNSITDNPDYYPATDQGISFSTDIPFLIEKVVVEIPFYAEGNWFNDVTTCNKAFGDSSPINGIPSGAIDFGGPGITFSLLCARKAPGVSYIDIIASGTFTHTLDDTSGVHVYKDPGMNYCSVRPVGFRSFSNPSTVISGTYDGSSYKFDGKVRLELQPSVAGGITFAREDRHLVNNTANHISSNRTKIKSLLTTKKLVTKGESSVNQFNESLNYSSFGVGYAFRAPYIHVQQISPLSRGSTGVEFNGNSPLGGTIAYVNTEETVDNPLFVSDNVNDLPSEITNLINANTSFDAVCLYSTVDSRPSPYLLLPGDKVTLAISKTRPAIYKSFKTATTVGSTIIVPPGIPVSPEYDIAAHYQQYALTGSHDSVVLNTGSIDITF